MNAGHAPSTRGTCVWCSITSDTSTAQRSRVAAPRQVVAAGARVPAPRGATLTSTARRGVVVVVVVARAATPIVSATLLPGVDASCRRPGLRDHLAVVRRRRPVVITLDVEAGGRRASARASACGLADALRAPSTSALPLETNMRHRRTTRRRSCRAGGSVRDDRARVTVSLDSVLVAPRSRRRRAS